MKKVKGGVVTISNHIHNMDATMNALVTSPRRPFFVTLKSNFEIPVTRHLVKALGGVPIPESKLALRKFNSDVERALEKGRIIHYYPEAALWPYYRNIRPFKNGAFRLAVRKNVPIVPIVFTFHRPKGVYRLYKNKPCITANILEPIYHNGNANLLKQQAYEAMNQFTDQYYKIKESS